MRAQPVMGRKDASPRCRSVLAAALAPAAAEELAHAFGALADPVRLRIISMLASSANEEVCVRQLAAPLGRAQPTVFHHLKVLSEAGIVAGGRRGTWVWYSLDRERLARLRAALGG